MSHHEDIMHWYKNCGHDIVVSQTNKDDQYMGVAICKDTKTTYRVHGHDFHEVLFDLKCMLNGTYHK